MVKHRVATPRQHNLGNATAKHAGPHSRAPQLQRLAAARSLQRGTGCSDHGAGIAQPQAQAQAHGAAGHGGGGLRRRGTGCSGCRDGQQRQAATANVSVVHRHVLTYAASLEPRGWCVQVRGRGRRRGRRVCARALPCIVPVSCRWVVRRVAAAAGACAPVDVVRFPRIAIQELPSVHLLPSSHLSAVRQPSPRSLRSARTANRRSQHS